MVDQCAAVGSKVPNNNSDDALHADHVWPITAEHLERVKTVEDWVPELRLLATVVCVTARENYDLMAIEKTTPSARLGQ